MIRTLRAAVLVSGTALVGGTAALLVATAAHAATATPTFDKLVAYARDGAIYTSRGSTEKRVTGPEGNGRPRWSPNGRQLAYLHAGELWAMNADGSRKHRVTPGRAAGPAFSPDGQWIAYAAPACLGGPGVYRVRATAPHGAPQVLFPAACREQAVPAPSAPAGPTAGALADKLRYDDAVAWSPDGTRVAFRGGDCESMYDNCLSVGTIATGMERPVAGFGGGGSADGFAVVPAFRADGARMAWTTFVDGDTIHLMDSAADGSDRRRLGVAEDRELAYVGTTGRALITGRHGGRSWVLLLDLATGQRTPFHAGSQPSIQP